MKLTAEHTIFAKKNKFSMNREKNWENSRYENVASELLQMSCST